MTKDDIELWLNEQRLKGFRLRWSYNVDWDRLEIYSETDDGQWSIPTFLTPKLLADDSYMQHFKEHFTTRL